MDIHLPQSVIEKLNRTPALAAPLTRKSRRASLSEIGFGKLETYKKILDLGEGTYATVYLGKSLLTGKSVALKVRPLLWNYYLQFYFCLTNLLRFSFHFIVFILLSLNYLFIFSNANLIKKILN